MCRKLTDSFLAFSEDGLNFQIHEYTETVEEKPKGYREGFSHEWKEYRTSRGEAVDRISEKEFIVHVSAIGEVKAYPNTPKAGPK